MLSQSNKDLILLKPEEYPIDFLTAKEIKLVLEMKEKLVQGHIKSMRVYRDDGHMLWRFLKAANLDVEEAVKMYVETVRWRRESFVEDLFHVPAPYIKELGNALYPEHYLGASDKSGLSFYLIRVREQNYSQANKRFSLEHIRQYHVIRLEEKERKLRETTLNTGQWQDEIIQIFDLKGANPFSVKEFANLFKNTVDIDANYYPALYRKILVINTPLIFKSSLSALLGSVAKSWMNKKILHILGSPSKTECKQVLLHHSLGAVNILTRAYGGRKEDISPCAFDWRAFDIRKEKEYEKKFKRITQELDIKNGFKFTKNTRVVRGMLLEWRYKSQRKPVLFSCRPETDEEASIRMKSMIAKSVGSLSDGICAQREEN
mmetsp:Transcript_15824/g.22207  ORF Transcript_15824/g.22207 Transcript_15824/m.22207 type:complete len:375 (+) Transcript_15824:103-1227(+)